MQTRSFSAHIRHLLGPIWGSAVLRAKGTTNNQVGELLNPVVTFHDFQVLDNGHNSGPGSGPLRSIDIGEYVSWQTFKGEGGQTGAFFQILRAGCPIPNNGKETLHRTCSYDRHPLVEICEPLAYGNHST